MVILELRLDFSICFKYDVWSILLNFLECLNDSFLYHHFQVNYINAHATSTLVGDLAEVNAIKKVFKNTSEIKMNATKVHYLYISV